MIAAAEPVVEIDTDQLRRPDKLNQSLLTDFAGNCSLGGFTRLNASAGKMPALNIGMPDQHYPFLIVLNQRANAN
jgi:hypothetical protein